MRPEILIVTFSTLASRARAQLGTPGAPTWVIGGRNPADGPANATGASTFSGPNISTSDARSDSEYEVSIAVYAEVAASATRPGAASSVSVIELRGVDAHKADAGWALCVNVWEGGPDVPGGGDLDDPGDCSAALPDACRNGFPSLYDEDGCGFPTDRHGGRCDGYLGSAIAGSREIGDTAPILVVSSAPFDSANNTALMEAYAEKVSKVWIMQLVWSHTDDRNGTVTRLSGPICFQANHIAKGSVDPRNQDGDGGGGGSNDGDNSSSRHCSIGSSIRWGVAMVLGFFISD